MAFKAPFNYIIAFGFKPTGYFAEPEMYAYMGGSIHTAWWSPYSGSTHYAHFHPGADLRAPYGTPIYASVSGIVTKAGWSSSSSGYAVNVKWAPGRKYVHGHMSRIVVRVGQFVVAGQLLGYVGQSGVASVPHSHFGIEMNGRLYDPVLFLPGGILANDARTLPGYCLVKTASRIRSSTSGTAPLITTLSAATVLEYRGTVTGSAYPWYNGSKWVTRTDWAKVVYNGVVRYVVRVNIVV